MIWWRKFEFYRLGRLEAALKDLIHAMNLAAVFTFPFIMLSKFEISAFVSIMLFCLKDFASINRSPMKERHNLQVLTKDNRVPNKIALFGRNLFIILFPVEILMILIFGKRIGDLVFNTKVIEYDHIDDNNIGDYVWNIK